MSKIEVKVYLDDGRHFRYFVESQSKAREHMSAIIMTGYRHIELGNTKVMEWFPPRRILKVKMTTDEREGISTSYYDIVGGM